MVVVLFCRYLTESYGISAGVIEQRIVEGNNISVIQACYLSGDAILIL